MNILKGKGKFSICCHIEKTFYGKLHVLLPGELGPDILVNTVGELGSTVWEMMWGSWAPHDLLISVCVGELGPTTYFLTYVMKILKGKGTVAICCHI